MTMTYLCSIISYILILILFIEQNILILYCLKLTPYVTKTSHMSKNNLIFLILYLYNRLILVLEVLSKKELP